MVRPRKEFDVANAFSIPRILTLDQLCRKMRASRSAVLRRLDEHGYYSSYNHSERAASSLWEAGFGAFPGCWT